VLCQGRAILEVDERCNGRLERFLTQMAGTAPGQTSTGEVDTVGHLDQAYVRALCHEYGVQVRQEVIGAKWPAASRHQMSTEASPLIDFEQHIGQVDVGDAPADLALPTKWGQGRELAADGRRGKPLPGEMFPPNDDVRTGDEAECLGAVAAQNALKSVMAGW
jgi:hypothetical protein